MAAAGAKSWMPPLRLRFVIFSPGIPGSAYTETLFQQKLAFVPSSFQHAAVPEDALLIPDDGVQWGPFRAGRRRLDSYWVTPYCKNSKVVARDAAVK
jgi:hypothetical protein